MQKAVVTGLMVWAGLAVSFPRQSPVRSTTFSQHHMARRSTLKAPNAINVIQSSLLLATRWTILLLTPNSRCSLTPMSDTSSLLNWQTLQPSFQCLSRRWWADQALHTSLVLNKPTFAPSLHIASPDIKSLVLTSAPNQ